MCSLHCICPHAMNVGPAVYLQELINFFIGIGQLFILRVRFLAGHLFINEYLSDGVS